MKAVDRRKVVVLAVAAMSVFGMLDWYSRAQSTERGREAAGRPQARQKAKPKKALLSKFMRAKLTASSQVLEGLCTEDYALIEKGAKQLHKVSRAEQWRVSNDAMYRQHSAEFRSDVDKIIKAAQKKKLDSAALAWTKTTLNCIECHRWVKAMLISKR